MQATKRTNAEAVLEQTRQVLQMAHAASSGGRPADSLLAPVDCTIADRSEGDRCKQGKGAYTCAGGQPGSRTRRTPSSGRGMRAGCSAGTASAT